MAVSSPPAVVWAVVTATLSVGFIGMGAYVVRNYSGLSARSMAAFTITVGLFPASILSRFALERSFDLAPGLSDTLGTITLDLVAIGTIAYSFFWLAFVLAYTTKLGRREKRRLLWTAIVLAGIVTLAFSLPGGGNVLFAIGSVFLFVLHVGIASYGTVQLFKTAQTHPQFHRWAALTLILPMWSMPVFFLASEIIGIPLTETAVLAYALTLGALLVAIGHYRVLDEVPAAQAVGRDTAVDTLETAIVVLDTNRVVADANDATLQLFDRSEHDVVGESLPAVLPDPVDARAIEQPGETTFEFPERNRVVRAQTAVATDESGRDLGRTIAFHDITDERRRQQRIQVLNRVLRHNLRNDLAVVNGYAEALAGMSVDLQEYPDQIKATANELIDLGEKAREIEQVVATDTDRPAVVSELLSEAVAELEDAYPDCRFQLETPGGDARVEGTVLTAVLGELLENAARHNDADEPEIEVTATVDGADESVEIRIADNGPGIPEHELTPIQEGRETDLEHGSGLGLWLVKWGTAAIDGQVSFEANDPRGTVVTLRLPAAV